MRSWASSFVAMVFVVVVSVVAVVLSRPDDALLLAIAPVVVVPVASLISLSHLNVDVTDRGVSIAFRDIVGVEMRRYSPLLEYGGWGVRLGPKGWGYMTSGNDGVQSGLRKGLPVGSDRRGPETSRRRSAPASRHRLPRHGAPRKSWVSMLELLALLQIPTEVRGGDLGEGTLAVGGLNSFPRVREVLAETLNFV